MILPFTLSDNQLMAQNSGERYVACQMSGCATIGNELCSLTNVLNPDGTVTTYWCVVWVVTAPAPPEMA